jgi:hypothetical protein
MLGLVRTGPSADGKKRHPTTSGAVLDPKARMACHQRTSETKLLHRVPEPSGGMTSARDRATVV